MSKQVAEIFKMYDEGELKRFLNQANLSAKKLESA